MNSNIILELLECSICEQVCDSPLALPCNHSFCTKCLKANTTKSNRITCKRCLREFSCCNQLEKSFKPSQLIPFLTKINSRNFDCINKIKLETKHGICGECITNKNLKEKSNQIKTAVLNFCSHCNNYLCNNCITRHCYKLQDETISELNSLHNTACNIVALSEKLTNDRQMKIYEYSNQKEKIKQIKAAFIEHLQCEEEKLLNRLDFEIDIEKKKLIHVNEEHKRLVGNKETTKLIRDMILAEKSPILLGILSLEFNKAKSEWLCQLKSDISFLDISKEKRLVLVPSVEKSNLIGSLEEKNENLKSKSQNYMKNSQIKSKNCSII